ncbi:MAG: LytTR family DNA-binding domain-containing protein [Phenylobacterium sp.]
MSLRETLIGLSPYEDFRGWLRGLAVAFIAGVFMAFSGAFDTGDRPLAARLVYWIGLMMIGATFGAMLIRGFFRGRVLFGNPWLSGAVASLVLAIPYTAVVMLASRLMLGSSLGLHRLPMLFPTVYAVTLIVVAINILMERRGMTAASPTPPKFLERLPLKLRGAEVWAVEAEDHYLRLHTSKGQDLILLRLADAVAELEGIEGAQVHRSWWVARDAITDARKGDGRATLTLKDGSEVPVSRTYAGLLRQRNWI